MTVKEMLADIKSGRKKKVILDTDAFNEIDDQYSICYCYLADTIELLSVNAAPFFNGNSTGYEDGMVKSYDEIKKVLGFLGDEGKTPVYYGSRDTIERTGEIQDTDAARNIIKTVKESDEPIYVLGIGACTNIASALLLDPSIKDNMGVIWLGANWIKGEERTPGELGEFNLVQDYTAGQYMINSGVPMLLCPAWCVVSELISRREDTLKLQGKNPAADYLYEITTKVWEQSEMGDGWVRTIWDIAAPACLDIPDCAEIDIIKAPVFTDARAYAFDSSRHDMLYLKKIHRDPVFEKCWSLLTK